MRLLAWGVVSMASVYTIGYAQQIVSETSCGAATQLGMVIEPAKLNRADLEAICSRLLQAHTSDQILFAVFGVTSSTVLKSLRPSEVPHDEVAPGSESARLQKAIRRNQGALNESPPLAALLRIGDDSVLVLASGRVSAIHSQLQGRNDPTVYPFARGRYSLAHIGLSKSRGKLRSLAGVCQLTMYFKSEGEPGLSDSSDLQARFQRLFPSLDVSVKVRRDGWFIDDDSYPDLPVLARYFAVPDLSMWLSAPQIICGSTGRTQERSPKCGIRGPFR